MTLEEDGMVGGAHRVPGKCVLRPYRGRALLGTPPLVPGAEALYPACISRQYLDPGAQGSYVYGDVLTRHRRERVCLCTAGNGMRKI